MKRVQILCAILLLAGSFRAAPSFAQVNSVVGGIVSDVTGALIPGVEVTARNIATGIVTTRITNGLLAPEQKAALDTDPYAYGFKANRRVLDAITQFSFEQGLTPRKLQLDEVFHPATLDL
jgi:hypothetical protein